MGDTINLQNFIIVELLIIKYFFVYKFLKFIKEHEDT